MKDGLSPFQYAKLGGLSSVLALAIWYPLDSLRTLRQTKEYGKSWESVLKFLRSNGVLSLYRGIESGLLSMGMSWFCYYYFLQLSRRVAKTFYGQKLSSVVQLNAGLVSGTITCTVVNPLWEVNTRMKLSHGTDSTMRAMTNIIKSEGVCGLFKGFVPSLLLVWNPAIQFTIAEYLEKYMALSKLSPSSIQFFIGAISKFLSTVFTYPLQVLKTRMQMKQSNSSLLDSFNEIIREEGIFTLFCGLEEKLAQTVLTSATMFLLVSRLAQFYQ